MSTRTFDPEVFNRARPLADAPVDGALRLRKRVSRSAHLVFYLQVYREKYCAWDPTKWRLEYYPALKEWRLAHISEYPGPGNRYRGGKIQQTVVGDMSEAEAIEYALTTFTLIPDITQ